jgi:hypothetical protein
MALTPYPAELETHGGNAADLPTNHRATVRIFALLRNSIDVFALHAFSQYFLIFPIFVCPSLYLAVEIEWHMIFSFVLSFYRIDANGS